MTLFRRLARLRAVIATAFLLLAGQAGCDANVKEKIALAKLAQNCLVNSDCTTPLVCAFEACHAECESSRDCQDGARCVAAARPYKVCQLEEERLCQRTPDCAEGLICGIDGECRDHCSSDSECVEGQLCVAGTCADTSELDDAGQLTPAPGATRGSEGSPCVYVSDCSAALLCRNQACLPQCKADKDCPLHQVCTETRCVGDGSQPPACSYTSDCDSERGERCLGGNCLCACAEDRDCPTGQLCDGCGCGADPNAPKSCVYNSDCDKAGEICRSRACACQCQADADCAAGSKCDGCGCVDVDDPLDGVVQGNVFIDSTLQLQLYRGVTEIHGNLTIWGSSIADLGDTFDELRLVEGRLTISGNQVMEHVVFPALELAVEVSAGSDYVLETIDLPKLRSATVTVANSNNVTTVLLGALETGGVSISWLPRLTQLSLPVVSSLNLLVVTEATALEKLELPELTEVTGGFQISSSSSSALTVLSAPKLKLVGEGSSFTIQNTKLTSLDDIGAPDWVVNATELTVSRNSLLSRCAAEAFVTRCADALVQAPVLSDNAACTTCDGATCTD